MKTKLTLAATIFISLAVNAQDKKTEGSVESSAKKTTVFGFQHRMKNENNDPFCLKPYRDSLNQMAVDMPNAYQKASDTSVEIPTLRLRQFPISNSKPIGTVEQMVNVKP